MTELLTGVTPGNNLGCPNCGCGGDSCGADGCICCHQDCYNVRVRDATPSGFTDSAGEWWRKSDSPLSEVVTVGAALPERRHTFATVGAQAQLTAQFLIPLDGVKEGEKLPLGYTWVEFVDGNGTVARYYSLMQDPSKVSVAHLPDRGWVMLLEDTLALWVQAPSYTWRFVALKQGDQEVLVDTTGELEVAL